MVLTFKGAKICAKNINVALARAETDYEQEGEQIAKGQIVDAVLTFDNAVYSEFGVVQKPQSEILMKDIPLEMLGRFDALMTEMYELQVNQRQIEADTAIPLPPIDENLPPLPPL
jgi:hypothetical protein